LITYLVIIRIKKGYGGIEPLTYDLQSKCRTFCYIPFYLYSCDKL